MKPYTKTSLDFKERPFDAGSRKVILSRNPDEVTILRYRNRYGTGAKLRRDRINRSYKKGLRQQYKKEIALELIEQ